MEPKVLTLAELEATMKSLADKMVKFGGKIRAADAIVMVSQKTLEKLSLKRNDVLSIPFGLSLTLSDAVPEGEVVIISKKFLRGPHDDGGLVPGEPWHAPEGPVHDLMDEDLTWGRKLLP